jgi:hypothetical protein
MLFDALKDFHYQELQLTIDGDIAGTLKVGISLLGSNPAVLSGAKFKPTINIEGPLLSLLNTASQGDPTVNAIVGKISGGAVN